jgi:hypothetical protein
MTIKKELEEQLEDGTITVVLKMWSANPKGQ